jgi:cytoskeletal protein CcmA (bactofilin family)
MWKQDTSVRSPNVHAESSSKAAPSDGRTAEKVVMDLGTSLFIKGELSASEDLTLYGHMDGSVTLPDHTLTIGPNADIRAAITAKTVRIMGKVTGNVRASEKIEIGATGAVIGDMVSPRLAITEGGRLDGKVEMPRGRPS